MERPISVIGSEYCVPKPIKLSIDTVKGVTHIDNELIFQVEKPSVSLHKRRVLRDFSGNPVLNLKNKSRTLHGRWQVFKGESKDFNDLVFSVKRSSSKALHKNNIDLEVFLVKNTEECVWDYRVNAGSGNSSYEIYVHGSPTILVKTTKRGTFVGEVQPNIDYAFIVALITIVDGINSSNIVNEGNIIQGTAVVVALGLGVPDIMNMIDGTTERKNMDDGTIVDDGGGI